MLFAQVRSFTTSAPRCTSAMTRFALITSKLQLLHFGAHRTIRALEQPTTSTLASTAAMLQIACIFNVFRRMSTIAPLLYRVED